MFDNLTNFIPIIFYQVLYMSAIGSIFGLSFYFIRNILDKKISGKLKCFIWIIILLTFIMPIRFEITLETNKQNKFISQVRELKDTSESILMNRIESIKTISNIESSSFENKTNNVTSLDKINTIEPNINKIDFKEKILNIIIPYLWILGLITLIIIFIIENQKFKNKISKNIYFNSRIEKILAVGKNQLKIKTKIKIILQDYKKVPSIFGIFRPSILITEETLKENDQTIKYIFLHELSHFKRKDIVLNHILILILSIHWFNPIIWFLFNKIREDIELATDELATKGLDKKEKKEYGMTLINLIKNCTQENYTASLLCISDTEKNIERRILMIKGKTKTTIIAMLITIVILGVIAGILLVKFKEEKFVSKIHDSNSLELPETVSQDEIENIENYINEICNNYIGVGRISQFDNINQADKNWIYGHLKPKMNGYSSKEDIEKDLKKIFGNDLHINLENDNEILLDNQISYDKEKGQYEFLPYGADANICYVINSIVKTNKQYVVNVIEYAYVSNSVIGKYKDTRC